MSDELRIITNHRPRPIIRGYELSADERGDFDHIDWQAVDNGETSPEFVRYQNGQLVDLSEFMTTSGLPEPLRVWDGYQSDSFFSGLLVKYSEDFESVVMGRYYS